MEAKIIGNLELINSKITSVGEGNIIFVDPSADKVSLKDSSIVFEGNNNLLYLGGGKKPLVFKSTLQNDSILYIGKNASFHKKADLHILCSERRHVFIGDGSLFSTNVWVRTSDAHAIYSAKTGERTNPAKSIIIGDHVWVGQSTLILKGTVIGSGSVIAAGGVTSNKVLFSNSIYGGVPAKLIGEEGSIFFEKEAVNGVTSDCNTSSENIKKFTYKCGSESVEFFTKLSDYLSATHPVQESIEFFKNLSKDKNRLAIHSKEFKN